MNGTMSGQDPKQVLEMTDTELENYRHRPETPLSILVCQAAEKKEYADLKDFLQLTADVSPKDINGRDSAGMTALHCAVASSCLPAVILLLKYGAHVNAKDHLGFTPLFLATGRYPDTDVVSHLIERNATVDATTKTGATPLHGAALQGNTDCVKLLLQHGADPRLEDGDGTTAFDLAKDSNIRAILHDAIIERDAKQDTAVVVCSNCKRSPKEGALKRCGQCHVTLYCSRECQIQHWKQGHRTHCSGYVLAKPLLKDGSEVFQTSFYHVVGAPHRNVKVFNRQPGETAGRMEFLRNKRFIVKVQLPLGLSNLDQQKEMMVYNADRTCEGFVNPTEKGYNQLQERIRKEGFMGIKAFFWAELREGNDGVFKVFHGKTAPYQNW